MTSGGGGGILALRAGGAGMPSPMATSGKPRLARQAPPAPPGPRSASKAAQWAVCAAATAAAPEVGAAGGPLVRGARAAMPLA